MRPWRERAEGGKRSRQEKNKEVHKDNPKKKSIFFPEEMTLGKMLVTALKLKQEGLSLRTEWI